MSRYAMRRFAYSDNQLPMPPLGGFPSLADGRFDEAGRLKPSQGDTDTATCPRRKAGYGRQPSLPLSRFQLTTGRANSPERPIGRANRADVEPPQELVPLEERVLGKQCEKRLDVRGGRFSIELEGRNERLHEMLFGGPSDE